ncbi:MAG: hypothetical protein OHK0039_31820 [Bacteroidia bacterium]
MHSTPFSRCLLFVCLWLGSVSLASAQATRPLRYSAEVEWQRAIFDPARGLGLKANYAWKVHDRGAFQSGLMFSGLWAPGGFPSTSGVVTEHDTRLRLQGHTGITRYLLRSRRLAVGAELYAGLRLHLIRGSLDQQSFRRDFSSTTWQGDFGSRLTLGYQMTSRLGVHLSLTNSWRELTNPLGPLAGLFFWGPDVLALGGLGMSYRL